MGESGSAAGASAPEHADFDAVVVGAGISGLSTAYALRLAGWRVQLVEAADRAGGVIASVHRAGCLYERGPNSALDTSPLIGALVDALGLRAQWQPASAASARRYVVRGGRLFALPLTPAAFVASPLYSPAAKLRLLREPFVARAGADADESIADFVRRRLGSEFLDYAIDPFVAGVYGGDPERISVRAAFPRLHAIEQRWGSLIRGQLLGARERRRRGAPAKNSAQSFSFAGGMQVLTDALAAAVGPVALGSRATRIERLAGGRLRLHAVGAAGMRSWQARALVLAVPAGAAATLMREHAPDAAAALDAIDYAPVATVASVYARAQVAHPLDGFGCLVPRREGRRLLGVLFSSTMFEGRASADQVLLTTFVGGMRNPAFATLEEDELASLTHAEHCTLLGARAPPLWQAVTRWPRAIPQYTIGHAQRLARAQARSLAVGGLFYAANWSGGVAVGDCIANGHRVADEVAAWLRS